MSAADYPTVVNLPAEFDHYQSLEIPEFGFDDVDDSYEYERAEARAELANETIDALAAFINEVREAVTQMRPHVSEYEDRDQEEADCVADHLDDAMNRLAATFGLLDTESSASRQHYIETGQYLLLGEAIETGGAA